MSQPRPITIKGQPIGSGPFPLIITPLVGRNEADIDAELQAILPQSPDMIEWRVDFFEGLGNAARVIDTAHSIRRRAGAAPLLLTCRHAREGGQPIAVDDAAVAALLEQACERGCVDLIDYELSNASADLARLRAASARHGVAMVMSYHNFQLTPALPVLLDRFKQAAELGADAAKVAVMPQDPLDVLTLLQATFQASQTLAVPLISMSMGALGSPSRAMGWIYGSAATFAVGKSTSAPGQISLQELRGLLATLRRAVHGG